VGLPLGAYLCFRAGFGAPGLWAGLSVALILIGSALLYFWRRKEKGFAAGQLQYLELLPDPEVNADEAI
jgi:MATE family multidrug resistance protein